MPAATVSVSPVRRSTRMASLARFRYREEDSDEKADQQENDDDDHSDSSLSELSELSFGSDIEDAIVGPRRGAAARAKAGVKRATKMTKAAKTIKTIKTATTGKRKRAETLTTGVVTRTLPERKKRGGKADPNETDEADEADEDLAAVKQELEVEAAATAAVDAATQDTPARRGRKPARVVQPRAPDGGRATVEPPSDWEEIYGLVKAMRLPGGAAYPAAVDTMGCERLAQPTASARDRRFQTLVALMLSSQTKDTVTAVVMKRLEMELKPPPPPPPHGDGDGDGSGGGAPGLTLANMLAVDPATLNRLIWQVGFHNNKTRYLKQMAEQLRDHWDGDIPPTAEGLMGLPGVGPKMAYLCLSASNGWNRVEGIGVDVHVHRITNLWGWQRPGSAEAKTPESTRLALQSWLPHDRWKEINWLLVGFGQTVCLPQGARCGDCTLGLRGLCRAANRKKVAEGRRRLEAAEAAATEVKAEAEVKTDSGVVIKTEKE